MAPHAETARQVQGVHGLGFKLPKHRPAHSLQLLVQLLAELGIEANRIVTGVVGWGEGASEPFCLWNLSRSAKAVSVRLFCIQTQRNKPSLSAKKDGSTSALCCSPKCLETRLRGPSSKSSSLHPIYASPRCVAVPQLPGHPVFLSTYSQPLMFLSPGPEEDDQGTDSPPPARYVGKGLQGRPAFILLFRIHYIVKLIENNL